MIPLNIQIKSILFSFLYGILFSFFTSLNYKYIYFSKGVLKIIFNIFFAIDNVLIYFIILRFINNGIIHYYFVIALILGFISVNKLSNKLLVKKIN